MIAIALATPDETDAVRAALTNQMQAALVAVSDRQQIHPLSLVPTAFDIMVNTLAALDAPRTAGLLRLTARLVETANGDRGAIAARAVVIADLARVMQLAISDTDGHA